MSSTNLDILTEVYQKLTVIDETAQSPSPEQVSRGLIIFNDLMAWLEEDGLNLGWYPQSITTINNAAPIRDSFIGPIKLMLMAAIALNYGIQLMPDQKEAIDTASKFLSKSSIRYFDSDLTGLPFSQGGLFGPGRI